MDISGVQETITTGRKNILWELGSSLDAYDDHSVSPSLTAPSEGSGILLPHQPRLEAFWAIELDQPTQSVIVVQPTQRGRVAQCDLPRPAVSNIFTMKLDAGCTYFKKIQQENGNKVPLIVTALLICEILRQDSHSLAIV